MIYNKSIINEKYGTCYPFYPIESNDPVVQCLLSHISSCTIFTPVGLLPPVHISAVAVNRTDRAVEISFKDKTNTSLGSVRLEESDLNSDDDLQFALWSAQGILLGYIELTNSLTFVQELMTGLSGALEYRLPSKSLRVLPFCTHTIQLPRPAVVQVGTKIPEYTYLGRGLLFNTSGHPGAVNEMAISVYAETPIGDYIHVPVRSINGVVHAGSGAAGNQVVWVDQKDPQQDVTVKTYDYILIQGYTEQ